MSPHSPFLALSSELRHLIYQEYFTVPGGYILGPSLQHLTTANGETIDLRLILTCKLIAQETKGLPLGLNTITFRSVHSEYINIVAAQFNSILNSIFIREDAGLGLLSGRIDDEIRSKVLKKLPHFKPTLDALTEQMPPYVLTERQRNNYVAGYKDRTKEPQVAFMQRQGITYTLQCIVSLHGSDILESFNSIWSANNRMTYDDLLKMINLPHEPWAIPSQSQLNQMVDAFPEAASSERVKIATELFRTKHRFSAAAAAIFFLNSIQLNIRNKIRNIILYEDGCTGPFPECHAQGLIPFCNENRDLRIERRINLWRTIFQEEDLRMLSRQMKFSSNSGRELSASFSRWFREALFLVPSGMPPNSMVTVFDGNPAPEACSQIFQDIVQRDVALVRAINKVFPSYDLRDYAVMENIFFEDLILGVQHLVNGLPNFQCNFYPGEILDIGPLCEDLACFADINPIRKWRGRSSITFGTAPPLPKWVDLLKENVYTRIEAKKSVEYAIMHGLLTQGDIVKAEEARPAVLRNFPWIEEL